MAAVESWDDDVDLHGDIFTHSVSTVQTSMSSRLSVRSESNAGDEDWQVMLTPNDELSTFNAISSAKQAGIPIPLNIPASALLGGSIKKLGKSKPRLNIEDDWGDDLELPGLPSEGLTLKPKAAPGPSRPTTPNELDDDFDDWAEGSLGIRYGGTKRGAKNRSSSVSLMSPSLNSCLTAESDEDELNGLVLPTGPVDFAAALQKRKETEVEEPETATETRPGVSQTVPQPAEATKDDFFADIEIGTGDVFDPKKLTLNRNIKQKPTKMTNPTPRTGTTLTFTDKPTGTRIPRPVTGTKPSRLEPVFEAGATASSKAPRRNEATTTSSQLLRSKRSMPALRTQPNPTSRPPVPFLPAGIANAQSHNVNARPQFGVHHAGRRESDPNRPQSPPPRPYSRLSTAFVPDTPTRSKRADVAPAALVREAAAKKTVTRPARRRNFGDGTELEIFDDLPTSAAKESKFIKQPAGRGAPKALRLALGKSTIQTSLPERMMTPLPSQVPGSPMKQMKENTPRFARDTAASRIAREQRLANTNATSSLSTYPPIKPRNEGPVIPVSTNWKAQVAARSPHTSPSAHRGKKPPGTGLKPSLIKPMGTNIPRSEKGMTYNPVLHRWEGNENALNSFDIPSQPSPSLSNFAAPTARANAPSLTLIHPVPQLQKYHEPPDQLKSPSPSPPRPALITNFGAGAAAQGVQVNGGMVFDPRRMCWLKLGTRERDPMSPVGSGSVVDDDEDPFAGIDDLPDDRKQRPSSSGALGPAGAGPGKTGHSRGASEPIGSVGRADDGMTGAVQEEFDLGPEFIRRQREEEQVWRRMVQGWFGEGGERRVGDGERWRYRIRELAGEC